MNQYLLDTNRIIFLLRNKYRMADKMAFIGLSNCFISEITLAELKVGAEKSNDPAHARMLVDTFEKTIRVLPITNVLTIFASAQTLCDTEFFDFQLFIKKQRSVTLQHRSIGLRSEH